MRWRACALSQLILPQWIVRPLNLDEFIGYLFVYIRFSRLYLERIRNAWILSGARTRPLQHIADSFALASVQLGKVSMSMAHKSFSVAWNARVYVDVGPHVCDLFECA